ncbi:DUF2306 domain-containing protein [Sphingobium sp.]|uniref:DUF2306 domain-containing protein n=1 Tax=Sphingobium sp. TaxID=1912891 RepID=UPI000DAF86C9|nr:DUF2306 domain-containing protein [Sphingobium sp.]PZU64847.1 MAG: hypothetical protein DI540_18990 [Sphingobium sp.]
MGTDLHSDPTSRSSASLPGVLFLLATLSTLVVIWTTVLPMIDGEAWPRHAGHLRLILTHVTGGLSMIVLGAAALFIGWTRRLFRWHRWVGRAYLILGSMAAILVFVLGAIAPHDPRSLYIATDTLALVWLAVAGMGWRAARNRRFASHREWMMRSYVLSWTFVGCRLATMIDFYPWLGIEGVTAAVWVNWIVPLMVCEVALRWRDGSRLPA